MSAAQQQRSNMSHRLREKAPKIFGLRDRYFDEGVVRREIGAVKNLLQFDTDLESNKYPTMCPLLYPGDEKEPGKVFQSEFIVKVTPFAQFSNRQT